MPIARGGGPPAGWVPVATSARLASAEPLGRPSSVEVFGARWALARLDGAPVVLPDRCPHRRVPLSLGHVVATAGGQRIVCAYHGWAFDGTGACRHIPALGDAAVPVGMRAAAPAGVVESHGLVWASWAAGGPFPSDTLDAALSTGHGQPAQSAAFVPVGQVDRAAGDVVAALGGPGAGLDPARLPGVTALTPCPLPGPVLVAARPAANNRCALYVAAPAAIRTAPAGSPTGRGLATITALLEAVLATDLVA